MRQRRRTAKLVSMPRLLRRLLIVSAIVLVPYLIGGNIFLNSRWAHDLANRKPERFQATWSGAVTWFPGMIVGWNVVLRGHAHKVSWKASADRLFSTINLIALLRREVRSGWVRATSVTISADRVANDLPSPPYREDAWTLVFPSIASSSIRQLRFEHFTMEADGSVEVGFIKQIRGGPFELLPSRATLRDARLRYGDRTLLSDARIDSTFAIPKHRREDAPGWKKLEIARGTIAIDGVLPMLGFELDQDNRWRAVTDRSQTDARLIADVGFAAATLEPGGSVEIKVPLSGKGSSASFSDNATLRGELVGDDAKLSLHLPPPPQGQGSADAEITVANARVDLPRELKTLVRRSSGRFDMDWHFESLDWLDPLLMRARWLQLRGSGDVRANLRMHSGVLLTGSNVDVPHADLGVVVAEHRFFGSTRVNARVVAAGKDSDGGAPGQLAVDAALDKFDIAASAAPDKSLVQGRDLKIDLTASSDLAEFGNTSKAHLRFKQAEMPDIRAFNRYLPSRSVVLLGGSNRLDGDVHLNAAGKVATADVKVSGSDTRARLGAIKLAGDFELSTKLVASKTGADRYELAGSRMKVSRLRVGDGDYSDGTPTWATLDLHRGTITTGQPLRIDADANITMENIRLLLALFTRHRAFPKWVIRLADSGVLQATGLMRSQGDTLIFDRVKASNDRFDAAARMKVKSGTAHGDLLLHWGVLTLGLEVNGDQRDFHLIGARKWYESQADLLPETAKATD